MSDERFLAAIEENPGDETVRLVYFDYLSECGHEAEAMDVLRPIALARHLECDLTDVESLDEVFEAQGKVYLVLTAEEADEQAKGKIMNDLWMFNADFLINYINFPENIPNHEWDAALKALKLIQERFSEDCNGLLRAMIKDVDDFVHEGIGSDGRGHFLAPYDDNEYEERVNGVWFYIYRQN